MPSPSRPTRWVWADASDPDREEKPIGGANVQAGPRVYQIARETRRPRIVGWDMRYDMDRVLVERPRSGAGYGGKGYRKQLQRTPIEDQRTREGIRVRSSGGSKSFNDHLAPLERFLRTN